jgi:hypothetical protein
MKKFKKNKQISDREAYDISFARIAWAHIREIQQSNDPVIKTQIFGNLNHLIRVWSGDRAKLISKNALELFREIAPEINPFDARWEQRNVLVITDQENLRLFGNTQFQWVNSLKKWLMNVSRRKMFAKRSKPIQELVG